MRLNHLTEKHVTEQSQENSNLDSLKRHLDRVWRELFEKSRFLKAIKAGKTTKALYALYLLETYHYTRHNSRNQALVGVRLEGDDPQYQRFCFHHAAEEAGHEQMATHDIRSLGLSLDEQAMPPPLPETTVLIAYLYWISLHGNPVQRLGYSYWAESCYEHVLPLMAQVSKELGLSSAQTTFFVAHAEIDEGHAQQVNGMLNRMCARPEDWDSVREVMETSLKLTGRMMDAVYDQYESLLRGSAGNHSFLKALL